MKEHHTPTELRLSDITISYISGDTMGCVFVYITIPLPRNLTIIRLRVPDGQKEQRRWRPIEYGIEYSHVSECMCVVIQVLVLIGL